MRIALIRHPAPLIDPGICYGRLDVGLAAFAQNPPADLDLHGARHVWSSPATRCRVVAEAVAATQNLPLIIDPRLQELDFGVWEGRAWDTIPRAELDRWAESPRHFAPPGGESGADLIARVQDIHAVLRRRQQDCVVVSHGGPLKVLAALLLDVPVDLLAAPPPIGSVRIITCEAA